MDDELEAEIIDAFEQHNAAVLGVSVAEMKAMSADELRGRLADQGILDL